MNQADDRDWLEALAGRETADSATRREARVLRAALRSADPAAVTAEPPNLAREAQLIARAVEEKLIAPTPPLRRSRWLLPIAAGVLLTFSAGILLQFQQQSSQPEVVRGDDAVVRIAADDPAALKQRILRELRAAGIDATGYEALGAYGIDAELPRPLSEAAKRVLETHHIPEPADGVLRVEIRSRE
jgi:hypothetical protein